MGRSGETTTSERQNRRHGESALRGKGIGSGVPGVLKDELVGPRVSSLLSATSQGEIRFAIEIELNDM
jgi:hypothetical protein